MTHVPPVIYAGSTTAKAIEVLRAQPPGTRMSTRDLCQAAGVPLSNASQTLRPAMYGGYLVRYGANGGYGNKGFMYALGEPCEFADRREVMRRSVDMDDPIVIRSEPLPEPILVTKLRDLFYIGSTTATGEPLRLLADALQAARQVLDARGKTRFKGAEVEQFVGREIRAISTAILNATKNLNDALETTL